MTVVMQSAEGVPLRPLTLLPGCNTQPEVIRSQMRHNIERDLPWLQVCPAIDQTIAIVAGGPSLNDHWPKIGGCDAVLSTNNTYAFLTERGIVPDHWMLLDARRENIEFLRDARPETQHYLAAQCHPDIYDALEGYKLTLYLTTLPDTLEITKHINKTKVQLAGVVGTVGIKAMSLAFALGYRKFKLFGYDSSYADTHHAYPQALNDASKTIEVYVEGKRYVTTPSFAHQAQDFAGWAKEMALFHGCEIELHCDGLLPHLMDYCNREGERPLEDREREKYNAMWRESKYRRVAPGEQYWKLAVDALGMKPGDSVIDFGCGSGMGAQRFQDAGYAVTGVDFASNCLNDDVSIKFVESCLWRLPADLKAEFGYCTDVMEHIPIERVDDVLAGISKAANKTFFAICTSDDNMGVLIGRKLHMSILSADCWRKALGNHWSKVTLLVEEHPTAIFACEGPR